MNLLPHIATVLFLVVLPVANLATADVSGSDGFNWFPVHEKILEDSSLVIDGIMPRGANRHERFQVMVDGVDVVCMEEKEHVGALLRFQITAHVNPATKNYIFDGSRESNRIQVKYEGKVVRAFDVKVEKHGDEAAKAAMANASVRDAFLRFRIPDEASAAEMQIMAALAIPQAQMAKVLLLEWRFLELQNQSVSTKVDVERKSAQMAALFPQCDEVYKSGKLTGIYRSKAIYYLAVTAGFARNYTYARKVLEDAAECPGYIRRMKALLAEVEAAQ